MQDSNMSLYPFLITLETLFKCNAEFGKQTQLLQFPQVPPSYGYETKLIRNYQNSNLQIKRLARENRVHKDIMSQWPQINICDNKRMNKNNNTFPFISFLLNTLIAKGRFLLGYKELSIRLINLHLRRARACLVSSNIPTFTTSRHAMDKDDYDPRALPQTPPTVVSPLRSPTWSPICLLYTSPSPRD